MKATAVLIMLLLSGFALAQEQVTFNVTAPRPGQTFIRTSTYKMDIDSIAKFAGQLLEEANKKSTMTVRKSEKILEANGDAITKIQVTYEIVDFQLTTTDDGIEEKETVKPSPIKGQTYIVSVTEGAVKVTDSQGIKPSQKEIEIVSGDYKDLGKADSFLQFFRQKTVQVGQPLQMPGIMAEGMFTDTERRQIKVDAASFILKSVRQKTAVFDTVLRMQWNQNANTSMKLNVKGETVVGIQNGHLISSTLIGTVRVTGAEQLYNRIAMIDGKGTITVTENVQQQ